MKAKPFDPTHVRRVLFATDFSDASASAARTAQAFAKRFGAELHVLHAVAEEHAEEPLEEVERIAVELADGRPAIAACVRGKPAEAIVGYVLRHAIDLCVVGTHGRTGPTRAMLGSVAERVARTCPVPVVTVPGAPGPEPPEPKVARCVVCSCVADDLICAPCRDRIRAEALERKRRDERGGR
jgi:nucleotide-binding universal stress UspA family protein